MFKLDVQYTRRIIHPVAVAEESILAGQRGRSSNCTVSVLVHLTHHGTLLFEVRAKSLNDAKAVNPQIRDTELSSNKYSLPKCL
jgi:hypothetical protein